MNEVLGDPGGKPKLGVAGGGCEVTTAVGGIGSPEIIRDGALFALGGETDGFLSALPDSTSEDISIGECIGEGLDGTKLKSRTGPFCTTAKGELVAGFSAVFKSVVEGVGFCGLLLIFFGSARFVFTFEATLVGIA